MSPPGPGGASPRRPPLAYRLTGRQLLVVDCAVAVAGATVLMVSGLIHGTRATGAAGHVPLALLVAAWLAGSLPVAVRRLRPVPVLLTVAVGAGIAIALGRAPLAVYVLLGMAVYTGAARNRRPVAIALLAATELVILAAVLAASADSRTQIDILRGVLTVGALWFIGDSVRERRRYLAGQAEQAGQRRRAEAERSRQAVREERVRIARELHDVVAHSLGVVTIQAGVGRKVGASDPGEAVRALRAVEVTCRDALEELRRILGLLRDDDAEPSLAPAPGVGELEKLAATVRAAGTPVRLSVSGDASVLPPAAALTVYRIVQEALTNVVKHAPGAHASVQVRLTADGVRINVTDDGPGRPPEANPSASGHGVVGMRERASAFHGTLEAGPLPGGGFRVRAFLPVTVRQVT